uniref:SH2 domain-containing protein n=1 Tax=Panagrellus redivivus TaxID=6233 RepID=A0A7E4V4N7_PANRE
MATSAEPTRRMLRPRPSILPFYKNSLAAADTKKSTPTTPPAPKPSLFKLTTGVVAYGKPPPFRVNPKAEAEAKKKKEEEKRKKKKKHRHPPSAVNFDPYEWESYYFANISRDETEEILLQQNPGTFLVRNSTTRPDQYVLSIREIENGQKKVYHYLIAVNDGKCTISYYSFKSIYQAISFLKGKKIDKVRLYMPAPKRPIMTVMATHRFLGHSPQDLAFERAETLQITRKPEDDWWVARNKLGNYGYIPWNYVCDVHADSSRSSTLSVESQPRGRGPRTRKRWFLPAVVKCIKTLRPSIYINGDVYMKPGHLLHVIEVKADGNCYGRNMHTNEVGHFPFTFVEWTDMKVPPFRKD